MIGEKLLEAIVNKGGDLIREIVPDKDLAKRLEHEWRLAALSADSDLRMAALQADRDVELAIQQTAQAEQAGNDTYTKRTRPLLARRSFHLTVAYVAFCLTTQVTRLPDVAIDWAILTVLASPMLAYMGVRTFDKWRNPSG